MAQLNFQIPDDLLDRLDRAKPDYLDRKGFLCLLLDRALDTSVTLGGPSAAGTPSNTSSTSKKSINKPKSLCVLPAELQQHESLVREFWSGKKGSKGETAWKLLVTELNKIRRKHGDAVVGEQLQLAINGKWQGITLKNYEQFSLPKGNAPAQPEGRHPASRVFTADRGFDDEPVTNPILSELF